MRVLSLFDGISCGKVALDNVGVKYSEYLASEIQANAISVSIKNHPSIKQVGDVTKLTSDSLGKIDLLIAGSPCQDLSVIKEEGKGLSGSKSGLFYEYVRLKNELQPKYFLLENVRMKQVWRDEITKELGVEPILINSSNFSGQNRNRYYWTNIPFDRKSIEDNLINNKIVINDIKETTISKEDLDVLQIKPVKSAKFISSDKWSHGIHNIGLVPESFKPQGNYLPRQRVFGSDGKSRCLTTSLNFEPYYMIDGVIRRLSPLEFELLQGLQKGYTDCLKLKDRIKCVGNGWTVPVIEHIFKGI